MAYKIKKSYTSKGIQDSIMIKGSNVEKYLQLRQKGYKTLWTGEGKILMIKRKKDK